MAVAVMRYCSGELALDFRPVGVAVFHAAGQVQHPRNPSPSVRSSARRAV
ncbi:hypothetical protein KCP76_20140 [Salmonella enterica subsp. enterica serovar Weltevreden]|nr:hypothetical protein KCP76_20140 [Salmonella enterica subsp. enterica serovar Weltevreden]